MGDRLLTFKETAGLLERAPAHVWRQIYGRAFEFHGSPRMFTGDDLREFVGLNFQLFGPGKNEL
jgi:hypothetical protein